MDNDSKKLLCGIFAVILGGLGIQYFLVNKPVGGILTIILTLATCGFWEILMFIQGIMILCMSESEWRRKFVDSPSVLPLF